MFATLAKAAVGLSFLLAAVQAEPLALSGTYRFETMDRGPDNRPICTETWSFGADNRSPQNPCPDAILIRSFIRLIPLIVGA